MSDPKMRSNRPLSQLAPGELPPGELPPIPDGCGILPIAENCIARGPHPGPHPQLLDAVPEGFAPLGCDPTAPVVSDNADDNDDDADDAMEQTYRRVLARAMALAAGALLFTSAVACSLIGSDVLRTSFAGAQLAVRLVLLTQVLFLTFCSRYVEKLAIAPAAALLFAYSAFSALEFSALLSPVILAVAFLCAGLMYAVTALWGYLRGADLARPITGIFMLLGGGAILFAVNKTLHSSHLIWNVSSIVVVIFAIVAVYFGQQIRDFYQEFDDDNAQGWKASVLGALLLTIGLINVVFLVSSAVSQAASRDLDVDDSTDRLPR